MQTELPRNDSVGSDISAKYFPVLFLLGFRGGRRFALGLLGFFDVLSAFATHERPPK